MTKVHELKIAPKYFEKVLNGDKTFEIRRNDRDFKSGDVVNLSEYHAASNEFTGRGVIANIGYVSDYEQREGFVVFSLMSVVEDGKQARDFN